MRSSFILALACAIVACGACTGGDGHDSPETTHQTTVASNLDPTRQPPASPIAGAASGGTITAITSGPFGSGFNNTLDPTEAYSVDNASILASLVTRSLTQWVYDSDRGGMVLIPDLATDLGTPNDDYTSWTFTIRDGVRFEDGTPVTANDVAFGIERSFDRKTFPYGPTYSNDFFLHGDTYRGPYRSGTGYDGVVVDGDKLSIKMARPFPDMPYFGAFPAMGPISALASDPATYRRHPLATGPYKVAAYQPQKLLSLVRNPEWDPRTDPGRHNYPDKFKFLFGQDERHTTDAVLADTGHAQTSLSWDDVSADDAARMAASESDRLTTGAGPCSSFLSLDYRKITDVNVRRAVGYAYPYQAATRLQGGSFTSTPVTTILPPQIPGRINYNALSTQPGETDPSAARTALKEAGYDPGQYKLTFAYEADDPVSVRVKDVVVKALEAGGFDAQPYRTSSFEQYDAVRSDPDSPINIRSTAWCLDWPSGGGSLIPLLTTNGGVHSWGTFINEPAIDAEVDRIGMLPLARQPAAWGELDRTIETKYYPVVMRNSVGKAMLHGSRIGGMNDDSVIGMPTWNDLYVIR